MKLHVLLFLIPLGLAGCASAPNPGDDVPTIEPLQAAETPFVDVQHFTYHTLVGFSDTDALSGDNRVSFVTPKNSTGLLVELTWNHTIWDLDPFIQVEWWQCKDEGNGPMTNLMDNVLCVTDDGVGYPRDGEFGAFGGSVGDPNNPAGILLDGEEFQRILEPCVDECDWLAWVEDDSPRADLDWHMFVSVFYGQDVPPDYTAIPWLQ